MVSAGEYIRSSAVRGTVVAADAMMSGGDGQPQTLEGVTVTLDGEHAMGETMETAENGSFLFTGLRAGTYTVTISDFPEDVSFETVSFEVPVEVGEVGSADFTGHYIRTSAIEGQVFIEGEGLAGVTVTASFTHTLSGADADESFTSMTDADGMFRFPDLRPGKYTVEIADFDPRDYEFAYTSDDVSVDLDETGTVSFTGVLLRTSGISGRVSVEGMGLGDIEVTLSGAADRTTTTDAGGQYAFSGLAAGEYTVEIAVESDAYVFDEMSKGRTVGDDESAIVNFDGQHARTASVAGQLFLDELDKNDMMDAGEHPLPAAGVPVALVGPGVNDQRLSATGPDGSFSFPNLRAGTYQLVVPIDATAAAALAANDVAYGGPGTGYGPFALGVGERKMQAVPFDITHTTVNFSVSLRSGDEMGDALPGASVSLYGTANAMVGSGMTGDDGSVAIKVARAMTSGNMVNAGVSADGYDVADGMTEVSWDPQMFATAGSNDNDIVNLNVDVTISGATVDRDDYGGGVALGGWAIDVMMGDAAVAGAPTALGDDGSAAFTTTVASVPASFSFAVADDQDDDLDGGEMYESSGGSYTHTGLSVAGNMDADPIVVTYTTQTLKVFVHEELDQVRGFTGNVLGGDVRMSGLVDLEIRQASGNDGRFTSPISNDDWDARANTSDNRKGTYTFSHLPADMDIVVRAAARGGYKLLDLERLDTYRNMDENGVMGGAFGAMGGFGHTVALCPLEDIEPTGQDFGDCASFGVVGLHDVTANVSKVRVRKSGAGFHSSDPSTTHQSGVTVSLTPVEGKNLAGVGGSFTTASRNDPTTPGDDRRAHDFGAMAAGAYELGLPDGWMAMAGDPPMAAAGMLDPLGSAVDLVVTPSTATLYGFVRDQKGFGLEGVPVTVNGQAATTDSQGRYIVTGIPDSNNGQLVVRVERAGYPTFTDNTNNSAPGTHPPAFAANTAEPFNISLSGANNTATITGTVTVAGASGAPIEGVEILVDGAPPLNAVRGALETGADGTYTAIVAAQPFNDPTVDVTAELDGWGFLPDFIPVVATAGSTDIADFEGRQEIDITGTVTAPGGGPMRDVRVSATNQAGVEVGHYVTTETGTFTVGVPALAGAVTLSARPLRLRLGEFGPTTYATQAEYDALVDADNYVWFDPPTNRAGGSIAVIPGRPVEFGAFKGNSVQPRITSVKRVTIDDPVETPADPANEITPNRGATPGLPGGGGTREFDLVMGEPTDTIEVMWAYETQNAYDAAALLPYAATNVDEPAFGVGTTGAPTLEADAAVGGGALQTPAADARTMADGFTESHTRTTRYLIPAGGIADYGEIDLEIGHDVTSAGVPDAAGTLVVAAAAEATGDYEDLAAVDGSINRLAAGVTVSGRGSADDPEVHNLRATWYGAGSPQLQHRIALEVFVENTSTGTTVNGWEWVVFDGRADPADQPDISRATNASSNIGIWGRWSSANFDVNATANATGAWQDDDNAALEYDVTPANLKRVRSLRIDTRVDGGDWVKHGSVTISR